MKHIQHPYIENFLIPPIAASISIPLVFYGFILKSSRQLEGVRPRLTFRKISVMSLKTSPLIGLMLGTQIIVQRLAENFLLGTGVQSEQLDKLRFHSIGTSLASAIITTPLLAVFNGYTFGEKAWDTLKKLHRKQIAIISLRETSIIFSIRLIEPINQWTSNNTLKYLTIFATSFFASIISHPADTLLTFWQQKRITKLFSPTIMRGCLSRSTATGVFVSLYYFNESTLMRHIKRID